MGIASFEGTKKNMVKGYYIMYMKTILCTLNTILDLKYIKCEI